MTPLIVRAFTLVNALGRGIEASRRALEDRRGGLAPGSFAGSAPESCLGRVAGLEREPITGELAVFDCRNNRLAAAGLREDDFSRQVAHARSRHGADRIGVFIGTSTSGSLELEAAFKARPAPNAELSPSFLYETTFNAMSVAEFVRRRLLLTGPAAVVTTACSSSAKVFATAYRHLQAGTCDAAVVGGVDSLCGSTLHGFRSLGVVSDQPCRPWAADRSGMSIGEGAGFALLERLRPGGSGLALLGYGESSDAHHMASPHPEGAGATAAMEQALARARLAPGEIGYINLHGTGTRANDEAEDRAVVGTFGARTPCSSTKGWTGHTLGAAGIIEALFSLITLETGLVPGTLNTERVDPRLSAGILTENRTQHVAHVLTNSFGFGGTNCSLIFGVR